MKLIARTSPPADKIAFNQLIDLFIKISEDLFILTKPFGKGYVRVYDVEKGLQVRFWNVFFENKTELYNDLKYATEEPNYTLALFFNTRNLQFSHGNRSLSCNAIWDTLFFSNVSQYQMQLGAAAKGHCLAISFSKKWLKKNVFQQHKRFALLEEKLNTLTALALRESMSGTLRNYVQELMTSTSENPVGAFYIKAAVLKILSDFFYRLQEKNVDRMNLAMSDPIAEVEAYLKNKVAGRIPVLKELARHFSISPSTLYRHFKKKYGMNLSSYFRYKKMEYARHLLNTGCGSLKQIAFLVGYKNVCNFKAAYQRYFSNPHAVIS